MTVYKILLLCLAVVALNARQSESLALKVTPQDCACFPTNKDNIRISQLADTYGKHERKVIYLFRHLDSQEITIYIPNEEKQLNFPDLTVNSLEPYDLHKMVHLYYIFDHPSDMVTVGEHLKTIANTSNHQEIPHKPTHPAVLTLIPEHENDDLQTKPVLNETEVNSTGLYHGDPGHVVIDIIEHAANSVTLIPEHEKDPDLQPKPTVSEINLDITGHLPHHGNPGYVILPEGKYPPSHVHKNTEGNNLPLKVVQQIVSSVTLVPEHENDNLQPKQISNETKVDSTGLHHGDPGHVVIDIIEHAANSVNLVPEHEKDPNLQPKPTVSEINPDITSHLLVHGEPGYIILPNGKYPPNYVPPYTQRPLPVHVPNSLILDPGHEKIVVNYPNQPENNNIDVINVIPEHDTNDFLIIKPTVNETKVNPSAVNFENLEKFIIDYQKNKPSVQPSTGNNIIVLDFDKQTVPPSVTTKPKDEDVTLETSIQSQETGFNIIQNVQKLLSEDNDNALLSSVNLKVVNSPVVDRWLIEEINHIIKSGPGTLSLATINLNEIKKRLLYILTQNGLQLSENGYLIDIHGHILQITNLKLRRVMISDPVAYKKLLGGRKCVPPYEIPYLEAVFVSMAHPSKVLGLIPLRISSLPGCSGSTCPGRPCALRKHRPVIVHHQPQTKLNMAPLFNKRLNGRGHYSHYYPVNKNGLLENPNMLDSTRIGDKEDDKSHHGADADDGLDIRIIGGNPATGSGTPVSSRGRSGYKESESLFFK